MEFKIQNVDVKKERVCTKKDCAIFSRLMTMSSVHLDDVCKYFVYCSTLSFEKWSNILPDICKNIEKNESSIDLIVRLSRKVSAELTNRTERIELSKNKMKH